MAGVLSSIGKAISSVGSMIQSAANSFVGKCVRAIVTIPLVLPVAITLGAASLTLSMMDKCWSEIINRTGLKKEYLHNPFLQQWADSLSRGFWGWLEWCSVPYIDPLRSACRKAGILAAGRGDESRYHFGLSTPVENTPEETLGEENVVYQREKDDGGLKDPEAFSLLGKSLNKGDNRSHRMF
jgi:hypothetical protein